MSLKKKIVIWGISLFIGLPFMLGVILGVIEIITGSDTETVVEITDTTEETTTEATTEATTSYSKEELIQLDKDIINVKSQLENIGTLVANIGVTLNTGQPTQSELTGFYDNLKNSKELLTKILLDNSKLSVKDISMDYYLQVELMNSSLRNMCDNLIKYIDKKETKFISKANESANDFILYLEKFKIERRNFFINNGFSEEEIPQM